MAATNFRGRKNPVGKILIKKIFAEPAGLKNQFVKVKKAKETIKYWGDQAISNAFDGIQ